MRERQSRRQLPEWQSLPRRNRRVVSSTSIPPLKVNAYVPSNGGGAKKAEPAQGRVPAAFQQYSEAPQYIGRVLKSAGPLLHRRIAHVQAAPAPSATRFQAETRTVPQ